jgi:two-component system chemotaxis response regulator CheY
MPEMDGMEFLRTIRGQPDHQATPVILVTAVADKENIMQATSLKVSGYVLKPITFQRIIGKLQEIFPTKKFPKLEM